MGLFSSKYQNSSTNNESTDSETSENSNDLVISKNLHSNRNEHQIEKLQKIKFNNQGNLVAITANEVTGDQIIKIIQNKNKELRTPLKYGFPLVHEKVIGRNHEVAELYKLVVSPSRKPVVITGMGGVGKTTLAIHCALLWSTDQQYEKIQNIAFLNAEREDTFKRSIIDLAEELNIRTTNREVREIMREIFNHFTEKSLLMVYDNVDAYSVVKYYLPENLQNVYVLATSQITELKAFFNCYELSILNETDSKTLVMNVFADKNFNSVNEHDIENLVKIFGGLPLGLLQAAAYIKDILENEDDEYSIQDYIKQYNQYLNEPFPDDFKINYKYTVYISLKINIEKIKEESTKKILWCMAYLNPTEIETNLFLEHFEGKQVKDAVRALVKYSLIKKEKIIYVSSSMVERLTIHRLLQEVCRKNKENEKLEYLTLTTKLTVKSIMLWQHYTFIVSFIEDDLILKILTEGFRRAFDSGILSDNISQELHQINLDTSVLDHWNVWHFATYCQYEEIIKVFRTRGLVFEATPYGWTPLHAAAFRISQWDIKDIINYLPKDSNIINAQTNTGLTSVHISAALGHDYNIQNLIQIGCHVNIPDNQGNTPLHLAIMNNQKDAIEVLINSGADINLKNNINQTPLEMFHEIIYDITLEDGTPVKSSHAGIIITPTSPSGEQLEKRLITWDILKNNTDGANLVINKLKGCHWWDDKQEKLVPELIKLLFNAPLALNIITSYILNENITLASMIQILNQETQHTEVELFISLSESHYKNIYRVVCMAIDKIEQKNVEAFKFFSYEVYSDSYTYFHLSISLRLGMKQEEINPWAKLLEQYSLIKIEEEHYYISDLVRHIQHIYSQSRKTSCSIIEHLIKTGLKDRKLLIRSPLYFMHINDIDMFCEKEYKSSERLRAFLQKLQTAGCNITNTDNWSALHFCCTDTRYNSWHLVLRLIELKVDINLSINKIRPIHLACFRESKSESIENQGDFESVKTLIQAEVNLQAQTEEGLTPLHLASLTGQDMLGLYLMIAGVDVNASDCYGNTPAHYAAQCGSVKLLKSLDKRNADMMIRNCNGETPGDLLEKANKTRGNRD